MNPNPLQQTSMECTCSIGIDHCPYCLLLPQQLVEALKEKKSCDEAREKLAVFTDATATERNNLLEQLAELQKENERLKQQLENKTIHHMTDIEHRMAHCREHCAELTAKDTLIAELRQTIARQAVTIGNYHEWSHELRKAIEAKP